MVTPCAAVETSAAYSVAIAKSPSAAGSAVGSVFTPFAETVMAVIASRVSV